MSPQEARSYLKELTAKEKQFKKLKKKHNKIHKEYIKISTRYYNSLNKCEDLHVDIIRLKKDIEV